MTPGARRDGWADGPVGAGAAGSFPVACPRCGLPADAGERYCEACGSELPSASRGPRALPAQRGWVAEIAPDRGYFDRGADEPAVFPADAAPRVVTLSGTRALVGRRSRSRGIFPEIDLSEAPEDRGVSRAHALLEHTAPGRLTVTDLGSANGTWVGDDPRPVVRGVAVALRDGSRIYLGSWTRITLRWH